MKLNLHTVKYVGLIFKSWSKFKAMFQIFVIELKIKKKKEKANDEDDSAKKETLNT